jgi:hypothetical protein
MCRLRVHVSLIDEGKRRGLTLNCSGFLQDRGTGRAGQLRAEDLRRCHGESDAQEDQDGEAPGAYDFDGESYYGGSGERSEGCASAAFPSGACDTKEGE